MKIFIYGYNHNKIEDQLDDWQGDDMVDVKKSNIGDKIYLLDL